MDSITQVTETTYIAVTLLNFILCFMHMYVATNIHGYIMYVIME